MKISRSPRKVHASTRRESAGAIIRASAAVVIATLLAWSGSSALADVAGTQCWIGGKLVGGFPPGYICPGSGGDGGSSHVPVVDSEAVHRREAEGHNRDGLGHYHAERWDRAMECFRKALEKWPDNSEFKTNLHNAEVRRQQEQDARENREFGENLGNKFAARRENRVFTKDLGRKFEDRAASKGRSKIESDFERRAFIRKHNSAVVNVEASADPVIKGVYAMAKRMQPKWTTVKLERLAEALNDLDWADDKKVTDLQLKQVWRNIKARSGNEALARKASEGKGPGIPGAGTQTRHNDCTIFALANAAGMPYGYVAARAAEVISDAEWRSAEERADPGRTIERSGLNGGEVILLAEVFGRARVVPIAEFARTLKEGSPVLLDVRHRTGTVEGHQVVLTKYFRHDGDTWYEMMDSYQDPTRRLYLSHKELKWVVLQNGVAFSREPGTVPELLR